MPAKRATMQQVAAAAGVSLKTVSRVVNQERGVSPALTERVHAAVDRLGYRHNLAASQLRRGQLTSSIGILLQDLGNDFCAELFRAVEDRAREHGLVTISSSLDEEPERERDLVRGLVERRIDGLILMPASLDQSYLADEIRSGLVVVVVDRHPHGLELDSVTTDNRGGAASGVRHLLEHGHRRIGFIGDVLSIQTAEARLEGYRDALRDAGLPEDATLERPGHGSPAAAEQAVLDLLALDDPPTALFTARNEITVGAVRGLRRAGRTTSVALVGFDDFATADLLEPAITVVQQNTQGQGRRAMDLLFARLDGDAGPASEVVLGTTLVPRGSGEIRPPGAE